MQEQHWLKRFFRYVEPRTDIVALAAFLLALGSIVTQIVFFIEGPEVVLFPPNQVIMIKREYPEGEDYLALIAAPMAYVNTGRIGHNGVIRRERVRFQLGGSPYEQVWHSFVSTDAEADEFKEERTGEAKPLPVNASSAESHETAFVPYPVRCLPEQPDCDPNANFLPWREFLRGLAKVDRLRFHFEAEIYQEGTVTATCYIEADADLQVRLIDRGWAGARCWEGEE